MNAIEILFRALADSFRPRMLMLTLISVAAAVVFWIVVLWLAVDPLVNLSMWALGWLGFDMAATAGSEFFLLGWLKALLVPLTVFGFLWPIVATSAVLLAGLYVTPPVVTYLSQRDFPHVAKSGDSGTVKGLWITIKATIIFIVLWIVTLPLWLIPGMALILPIVLTAYLLQEVMRFDSMSEHATSKEIKILKKRDSSSAWLIALVCAFLSLIPPILLIMPVMSALAFTRFYMYQLEQLRQSKTIEMGEI